MVYSAENTELWSGICQVGIMAGAMLLAMLLRQKVRLIRKALVPIAVLSGFLLLVLRTAGILKLNEAFLETVVYHCIALGFIAMSLRADAAQHRSRGLTGPKSGAVIVGSYLVQALAGLGITLLLGCTVMPGLFPASGLLLPMGYGQGPGQANNIGFTYESLGFAGGRSFGLALAASGYVCACVVGVIMTNLLHRRGRAARTDTAGGEGVLPASYFQDSGEIPVSDSIDKLSVQIAMVLVIYLAAFLLTWGVSAALAAAAPGLAGTVNSLLWGFNFLIGSAVAILMRRLLEKAKQAKLIRRQYQNNYLLNRISGFFFDLMIVAGIASINIEDLTGLWLPFLLLSAAGGSVTWLWLRWACRRVYPGYCEEGLISMYGMMTGTIGSGILLLREIDPELATPAANNLVLGSSFAIIFGAPILVLVGLAARSTAMCFVTLVLAAVYLAVLTVFICRAGRKQAAPGGGAAEE